MSKINRLIYLNHEQVYVNLCKLVTKTNLIISGAAIQTSVRMCRFRPVLQMIFIFTKYLEQTAVAFAVDMKLLSHMHFYASNILIPWFSGKISTKISLRQ